MTQTNYVNPNGLPDEQQVTSARDLAILARALIRDFPEYDEYWHIASIRLGRHVYRNTNKLIDAYAGSDGMKTGFICSSGFNLVATATRNGKRLIAVVLGAKSAAGRATKAAELFEHGFGSDPLSWLQPSQGTVGELEPVDAMPLDMHDEVCPKDHRQLPPAEDGDEAAAGAGGSGGEGSPFEWRDWRLPGSVRGAALLTPGLAAGIAPVDVYTGPARPPGWTPPPPPPGSKRKLAAKPPAAKSQAAKPAARTAPAPRSATAPKPAAAAGPKPAAAPKPAPAPPQSSPSSAPAGAQ
jgi:D-alanyl-D-alanine carboxypeptidase